MPISTMLMSSLAGSGGGGGAGQAASNIASGLLSGVTGFFQRKKAKKLLSNLHRPDYVIPEEITKTQKMAEMGANEGLPSQQYNQAMQNIQRQQSRSLSQAADRRGGLMSVAGLQQGANDALLGLDVANANARLQNQKTLYGISGQTAQYKDKAFQINKMQPYQQQYQYAQSLLGAGNQNLLGGADKLLGGAGGLAFGGSGGSGGGGGRQMKASSKDSPPTYYNGYGPDSNYSGFETGF